MARYIDADKVLAMSYCPTPLTQDNPLADSKAVVDVEDIESIPSADVEEVKHGEWIEEFAKSTIDRLTGEDYTVVYRCSRCGRYESQKEPYCNCGAKMDGGKEE